MFLISKTVTYSPFRLANRLRDYKKKRCKNLSFNKRNIFLVVEPSPIRGLDADHPYIAILFKTFALTLISLLRCGVLHFRVFQQLSEFSNIPHDIKGQIILPVKTLCSVFCVAKVPLAYALPPKCAVPLAI